MAALLLLTGPQAGRRLELDGEIFIGRSPSCTIALEDSKVSRRHVRLVLENGEARVSDLGSRNGTLVNGEKLDAEVVLLPGDRLQIGDSTVLFEPSARASLIAPEVDEPPAQVSSVPELLPAGGMSADIYQAALGFLAATSEAMVLRRAAQELGQRLNALKAAALMGGHDGLGATEVFGAAAVEVPRPLVQGAIERAEAARLHGHLCAPISATGSAPFGVLYANRIAPFEDEELRTIAVLGRLVGEALMSIRNREGRVCVATPSVHLIGGNAHFRQMVDAARRIALSPDPVLLYGEPGSGRAQTARYIHSRSIRALAPLIEVDCRTSPLALDGMLFGAEGRAGKPPQLSALLRADAGSLLLLNVEFLPRHIAQRLASLLVKKRAPLPSGGETSVDVRLMTTGRAPLAELIRTGELDPEMGKTLGAVELETVPLRKRRGDIIQLAEWFLSENSRARRKDMPVLSPDAKRLLSDHRWPGNVEELRLLAERLSLLHSGSEVTVLALPPEVQDGVPDQGAQPLAERIARLERDAISEALRQAKGKKIRAAAALGISRPTLDKKIDEFNLMVEKKPS